MPQRKHQVPAPEAPRRRWVTQSYVAAHLGVTQRTVRDMTADGRLVGYRLNPRFVRYDLNEVDAAMTPFGGGHARDRSSPPADGLEQRDTARAPDEESPGARGARGIPSVAHPSPTKELTPMRTKELSHANK